MSAREAWNREMESAWLYRVLAEVEPAPGRRELFTHLETEARAQAGQWAEQAKQEGHPVPEHFRPDLRAWVVARLVRSFGPRRMRRVLAAMKVRGMSVYLGSATGHEMPSSVEEVGRRHRDFGGGNLRAAVFGANDGLVSNASLILGIAGATDNSSVILLSGVAGLLAGAFSMAAGEYVSVRSQRELFEHQIAAERDELAKYPAEEARELALIYAARGLPRDEAARVSKRLVADPQHALDTLAREELGLDPGDLGSPWGAALSSFLSFTVGAVLPLLPFIFIRGGTALWWAIGVTACGLFGVGATISLFTGRRAWWGGLRMLLIGAAAGAATFFIGRLLGVNVSG